MSCVVSVAWLAEQLKKDAAAVKVVDVSWYMPAWKRDPKVEYAEGHLPGAVFYDQTVCADKEHPLKLGHMLPGAKQFSEYVGSLGISESDHVVLYDGDNKFGLFGVPRAWWVFKAHGHRKLSVLDGGMEQWKAVGHQVTKDAPSVKPCGYKSALNVEKSVKSYEQVLANLDSQDFRLVDARPEGRFKGSMPEPSPKIKPGHIPHAVNIPFMQIFDSGTKLLKNKDQLKELFSKAGVNLEEPVVFTCGSAVTACHLVLAAFLVTDRLLPLYDGAWTEWFLKAPDEVKVDMPQD